MGFCPNCGKQIDDKAKFCIGCGTQIQQAAPNETAIQPKKKSKKPLIISLASVAAVLIIAAVVVLLVGRSGASSPEKALKKYAEAYSDKDGKALVNITIPGKVQKQVCDSMDISKKEMEELVINNINDVHVSVTKVVSETPCSKDEIQEYEDSFCSEYETTVRIQSVYTLHFTCEVYDADAREWYSDESSITAYKSGGRWYISYL